MLTTGHLLIQPYNSFCQANIRPYLSSPSPSPHTDDGLREDPNRGAFEKGREFRFALHLSRFAFFFACLKKNS